MRAPTSDPTEQPQSWKWTTFEDTKEEENRVPREKKKKRGWATTRRILKPKRREREHKNNNLLKKRKLKIYRNDDVRSRGNDHAGEPGKYIAVNRSLWWLNKYIIPRQQGK